MQNPSTGKPDTVINRRVHAALAMVSVGKVMATLSPTGQVRGAGAGLRQSQARLSRSAHS